MATGQTSPRPYVVAASGPAEDAPAGSVPINLYGSGGDPVPADPVVAALIAAGFGTAGQILATNAGGDGFEWVDQA